MVRLLQQAAAKDDPWGTCHAGMFLVTRDKPERHDIGLRDFQSASANGHEMAHAFLAWLQCLEDSETERSIAQNLELLVRAARSGIPTAHYLLGIPFRFGLTLPKIPENAFFHFKVASEFGTASGMAELGRCLLLGEGVEVDEVSAVHWLAQAESRSRQSGKAHLAYCYLDGPGIE